MAVTDLNSIAAGIIGPATVWGKDSATAEQAGTPHTPWYGTGIIGAGAAPTGALNGATFTAPVNGAIGMPSAVSGKLVYLERMAAVQTGNVGHLWLIDRIWGNVPVVTTTTGQAITAPTWPARDVSASTNGAGVMLALECSSASGNGSPITNTTVTYTNSAGTASHTATLASFPSTAVAGTFVPFSLQAGDVGVRTPTTITLGTSYVSGAVHLVAFRLIAELPMPISNTGFASAFPGNGLPTIWDGSVLQLVYWPASTALGSVAGSMTFCQV